MLGSPPFLTQLDVEFQAPTTLANNMFGGNEVVKVELAVVSVDAVIVLTLVVSITLHRPITPGV